MRYVIAFILLFMAVSVFADQFTIDLTTNQVIALKSMTRLPLNATNEEVEAKIEKFIKNRAKGYIHSRV